MRNICIKNQDDISVCNTLIIEINKKDNNKLSSVITINENTELTLSIDKSTIKLSNVSLYINNKENNNRDCVFNNIPIDLSIPVYLMIKRKSIRLVSRYIMIEKNVYNDIFDIDSLLEDDDIIKCNALDDNKSEFSISANLGYDGPISIFEHGQFLKGNMFDSNIESFNILFKDRVTINDFYDFIYNISKILQNSTPELIKCYLDNTRFNLSIGSVIVYRNNICITCVDKNDDILSIKIDNPVPYVILCRMMSNTYSMSSLDCINMDKIHYISAEIKMKLI